MLSTVFFSSTQAFRNIGRIAAYGLVCCLLVPRATFAHHVMGIELSPEFELVHSLAEPFLFCLSGYLAASLFLKQTRSLLYAFLATSSFAALLATASMLEDEGGLFLLIDAAAFAVSFAGAERLLRRRL